MMRSEAVRALFSLGLSYPLFAVDRELVYLDRLNSGLTQPYSQYFGNRTE